MLFVVCFVGVFWVMLRCRVLTNAVKVVTSSNLIAVLLLPLWHILLTVFIFSFVRRRMNCVLVCFIPLKCCEPEENAFCGEQFWNLLFLLELFSNFSANTLKEALLVILLIQSLIISSLQILFQAKEIHSSYCFQYNYLWVFSLYPQTCVFPGRS